MIGNLNHVAIAVPDLNAAILQYQNVFGAFVTSPQDLPEHGVRIAVVNLSNTKIELITPLGEDSPIQKFLKTHPQGGIHHLCYEVPDIKAALQQLQAAGLQVIGDGTPKLGYQEKPVLFFNPKDALGVLIELEEVRTAEVQGPLKHISPLHTAYKSSIHSLEGVEGVEVDVETDFRQLTPPDNMEGN
ncbi:MAG: methylmalonyl-CoA epimerase [Alphaproteobacteria bacterium 41-28]|nr:MAG: methylmalonyl-CoA epimerase [Alphaproteobacteria bacterium 41-28]